MTMTPGIRKVALTAHITASLGWLGAVAAFEALAISGVAGRYMMVRAAYLAMERIAWFVIVPLAFTSLLTGLVMALGTKWGLFRHYWIATKLALNLLSITLLLLHTRIISLVATAAGEKPLLSTDLQGPRMQLIVLAAAALLALLLATTLGVFKPRGLTPYGLRKQGRDKQKTLGALRTEPAAPMIGKGGNLGGKIFFTIIGLLALLLMGLHLAGGALGHHTHCP